MPVVLGMGRTSSVCACSTGNGNGEDLFYDHSTGMLCLHPVTSSSNKYCQKNNEDFWKEGFIRIVFHTVKSMWCSGKVGAP